ncbi:MAG: type VI secretion system baseplate subunit TssF [Rhodocyclaceae bacterium]|nr:type VI secretion system baseplate subunit TssF [Rhodocyclaceae bacterium]
MHPLFYDYYNQELTHIRESAAEFAREFPKIANRLTLDGIECSDPYVERLLEGFAFLAARIQLKLDAEFPTFTQHLTEVVFPDYLSPVPSMAMVRFDPDFSEADLNNGVKVPRGTVLRGKQTDDTPTAPVFHTAHELTLWPLEIVEAKFHAYPPDMPRDVPAPAGVKGALRLRLRINGDATFDRLPLDQLVCHLSGEESIAARIYEQLFSGCVGTAVLQPKRGGRSYGWLEPENLERVGFGDDEAMLPPPKRSFRGYRLLREYAAFPSRYLFFRLTGLRQALAGCNVQEVELLILLKRTDPQLENLVDAGHFSLNTTPAINLFPKLADRIHLGSRQVEYHVLADRTRPMDFEVHSVTGMTGHGSGLGGERHFRPLYATLDETTGAGEGFYSLRREGRMYSATQKRTGSRTSYIGTEVFVSLVDSGDLGVGAELKQISVATLCSNRDLPILMPTGLARGDFDVEVTLPVKAIRCIRGPSRPVAPALEGEVIWRLVSHLSLNYLSLTDTSPTEGAMALRQMLELYGITPESPMRKQLEGVRSVKVSPIVRRMPTKGPVTVGRGLEVELTCDERSFEGTTPFVLAAVLEEFFARHTSINAFTETVLHVTGRGEIMRWKPRFAQRPVL